MVPWKPCVFPITRYEGKYRPTWTRRWTRIGGENGSWQFFSHARDITPDHDGEPYTWEGEYGWYNMLRPMLAGPSNDWGAFELVGLLQLDQRGVFRKACGCVSLLQNDLKFFVWAGTIVAEFYEDVFSTSRTPPVLCIPGTGGNFSLTLVTTNKAIGNTLVEVYFLRGRETGEVRSQLPGMKNFYDTVHRKKLFAKVSALFRGTCGE